MDDEKILYQKAKVDWLCVGDKNSAYFHRVIRSKINMNMVDSIIDEHGRRYTGEEVPPILSKHFKKFLGENKALALIDIHLPLSKKAWNVVRDDVCLAIKVFFISGKLFGELNATLITLVPKVQNHTKVTDFKPISYCNVIYKCIGKNMTNTLKTGLSKIFNINQSTFIPGRLIQDNILIIQELLRGYSRKNGQKRCAMKIDVQKAYDSGSRGLRQGDPISAYLFTLIMEVFTLIMQHNTRSNHEFKFHYECKEMKLTHLTFADDLLVLCHGDCGAVVKHSLEAFSRVSGLYPKLNKSTIFFGSLTEEERYNILSIMPSAKGKLSMKYLCKRLRARLFPVCEL
ncbi:RNA-directed DNA polymerase, eukaryota, reverse transcriptase zinc-binding domain protein [Tanacetum coccineum]